MEAFSVRPHEAHQCGSYVFLQLAQGDVKEDTPPVGHHSILSSLRQSRPGPRIGQGARDVEDPEGTQYSFLQSVLHRKGRINKKDFGRSRARTGAIFYKNMVKFRRSFGLLVYSFLLPSVEVMIFCAIVGKVPFDLTMAVINKDTGAQKIGEVFLKHVDRHILPQVSDKPKMNGNDNGHETDSAISFRETRRCPTAEECREQPLPKSDMGCVFAHDSCASVPVWRFRRISDFGFRISDFGSARRRAPPYFTSGSNYYSVGTNIEKCSFGKIRPF